MQEGKNRKSLVVENTGTSNINNFTSGGNMVFNSESDIQNKQSKTYYNLHLQNNQFENSKLVKQVTDNSVTKKYPVYTNLPTQGNVVTVNEPQQRQTISQVKRQNNNNIGKFQFDTNMTLDNSKNKTTSLSQIQKKYNFTSTTKFNSQERKERVGQSHGFGVYNRGGMTNTNGFNKYDN